MSDNQQMSDRTISEAARVQAEGGVSNPFRMGNSTTIPAGALVSIEQQRAIAEVQARMIIARANPRDPLRAVDNILRDCMRERLAEGALYQYAKGGSSISDYVDADGRRGFFQFEHRVYQRTGEPCVNCGAPIRRTLVAQRGTHFCAKCQRR